MSFLAGLGATGMMGGQVMGQTAVSQPIDWTKVTKGLGALSTATAPKKAPDPMKPDERHDFSNSMMGTKPSPPSMAGGGVSPIMIPGLSFYGK